MTPKIYKIYRLINIFNGLSYIGYTYKKLIKRITDHVKANSYIGNSLRKYELKNFKVEIFWEAVNKKEANIVEKAAICAYKTQIPNGYNIALGGEGGDNFTNNLNKENIRKKYKKMQNAQGCKRSKEFCENLIGNKYAVGNKHSKEADERTSERIRKTNQGNKYVKGYKHSKQTRLKKNITQLKNSIKKLEKELKNEC